MKKTKKFLVGLLLCLTACLSAFGLSACEESPSGNINPPAGESPTGDDPEKETPNIPSEPLLQQPPEEVRVSEGLEYDLSEDETYYIVTGIGECTDKDIVIPTEYEGKPVTSIGDEAFYECDSVTSVAIGDSVTSIGIKAFRRCSKLQSLILGSNVNGIGEKSFQFCKRLIEIYNKSNLTITEASEDYGEIGYYAKNICKQESERGTFTVENNFLVYTYGINNEHKILMGVVVREEEIIIPNGITEINAYALSTSTIALGNVDCIKRIAIPNSVKKIGAYAFSECNSLEDVILGKGITSIEDFGFYSCSSLKSIEIPNSMTSIGKATFAYCGLTNIEIPNSITSIGSRAFSYCNFLINAVIDAAGIIGDGAFV